MYEQKSQRDWDWETEQITLVNTDTIQFFIPLLK